MNGRRSKPDKTSQGTARARPRLHEPGSTGSVPAGATRDPGAAALNLHEKPTVTVVHTLPGRVRLRLSHPLANSDDMIASVRAHVGMGAIAYTPQTRSFLIHFDPRAIGIEEISLRTAFYYAMDQGVQPVRLLAAPQPAVLQNSAVLSGLGVLAALTMRWLSSRGTTDRGVDKLAGLATAVSIVDHGWHEIRARGYFDPEVLTLAYLGAAFVRGNVLTASAVTWLATFGRHLVDVPSTGVEVQPLAVGGVGAADRRYELVVGPDTDAPDQLRVGIVGLLNSVLKYAMTGGGTHGLRSLWEELHDVSRIHGQVLEGQGRYGQGIRIRFR